VPTSIVARDPDVSQSRASLTKRCQHERLTLGRRE
jgi:hypothetical protein